jgi:hypothetical protein
MCRRGEGEILRVKKVEAKKSSLFTCYTVSFIYFGVMVTVNEILICI